jgi:hypothetical protein
MMSRSGATHAQNLCGQAPTLTDNRIQQVDGLNQLVARDLTGSLDDRAHAWGKQDTLPEAIFAGAQGAPEAGIRIARTDPQLRQASLDLPIVLFQQGDEQMLDTDVVMISIPAFLLRGA